MKKTPVIKIPHSDTIPHITRPRLRALTASYASHVPAHLHDLDTFRLSTLRNTILARKAVTAPAHPTPQAPASKSKTKTAAKDPPATTAHITHPELQRLVSWKLQRGKWRPKLGNMAAELTPAQVHEVSARAFAAYDGAAASSEARERALAILRELKGVGPATASLVLSVYDPARVPFYSDELFVWLATAAGGSGRDGAARVDDGDDGAVGGDKQVLPWAGKMGYTAKEYTLLCERLDELKGRLEKDGGAAFDAVDVEHAAWMIVKGLVEDVGISGGQKDEDKDTVATPLPKKRAAPSEVSKVGPDKRKKNG